LSNIALIRKQDFIMLSSNRGGVNIADYQMKMITLQSPMYNLYGIKSLKAIFKPQIKQKPNRHRWSAFTA
jgi:hypothetical protein